MTGEPGDMDLWTFPANIGERVVLRRTQLTGTNNFGVWMRVYDPDGVLINPFAAGGVSEYAFTATTSGTYTVLMSDGSGAAAGTGTYRFHFAKLPGSFVIPPGDDGGPLPGSGGVRTGTGEPGDMDLWTFPASIGDRIVLRRTQLTGTNNFGVWMRVYDPNGVLINPFAAGGVSEYAFTATTSGTYTVLMSDGSGAAAGTGTYRFHFAKLPGSFVIPPGDDGGPLPGSGGIQDGVTANRGIWICGHFRRPLAIGLCYGERS